uniref:Securin n=1 Tax=Sphenodon punctatus TaxID=8508 RepID=A0A8D0G508_SPHPU
MATLLFVDKENGDVCTVATSKDRLRLPSASSKSLLERSHTMTPLVGKTMNVTPATSHSVRKALGNVNGNLGTTKKNEILKEKNLSNKKVTEKTTGVESCSVVPEEAYPEIENFFPYDPLDFDSFDLPEEHKLSHMSLTGVPLMVFETVSDRPVNLVPSPVKLSSVSWDCDLLQTATDFLSTFNEIDLPSALYDDF